MNPCYKAFVLAPIGIVKGTIVAAIVAPPVAVAVNVVTLINLPNDLYLLLKVVCTTVALGRNVKTLMMLLLAPIMCVVLTLVFVTPFLASFFGTLFVVAGTVFNNDIVTLEVVTKQKQFVVDYHKEHPENANRIAADVCNVPRAWSGRQFEIPLAKLFLGIVFIVYGTIVGGTLIPILNVLKVPFVYYRANKEFKNSLKNTDWWYFVFVLVGESIPLAIVPLLRPIVMSHLIHPPGWVLMNAVLIPFVVLVLVPLYCLTIGPQCADEALRVDVIGEGFREPLRLIRQFDLGLSVFCFDCEEKDVCSLVLEIEGRVTVSSSRSIHATEADVYCAFDEAACESVRGAVEAGWVAVGDLDAYEAHLMVGIPALAAHDVLAKEGEKNEGQATNTSTALYSNCT